jgi:dUTP pyrophosphatase
MKFLIKCKNDNVKKMYKNHTIFHKGDSGLDLYITEDTTIEPGEMKLIGLGVSCQLESSAWYCPWSKKYHSYMMFPRSSISKTPLRLANSIGLIDSGYVGEIKAPLYNTSDKPFNLKVGDRYVQLVAPNLEEVSFKIVESHRDTSRGSGGFGSTII